MGDVGVLMHAIRDACVAQQLPVDALITESAPSQYEINLRHQPDALQAADHAVLLQRAIKGVAARHDRRASFMAKPFGDQPGNGMHVHFSLLDVDGRNVFDDASDEGGDTLRHAVAGCLASMLDVTAIFAPNQNSYRRFAAGSHAPLAPSWGYENRTTAIRIPGGSHRAIRLEHRVAGADANPHLVIAAILAGALAGIQKQMLAPAPTVGNAYQQHTPSLPRFWADALLAFDRSEFVAEFLGAEFHRVYSLSKRQEFEEFVRHVTPMEYDAYL